MDFDKFYEWKRATIVLEMAREDGTIAETCHALYDILVEDGVAYRCDITRIVKGKHIKGRRGKDTTVTKPGYRLTDEGNATLPASLKTSNRLLAELLKENEKLVRKIVNQLFKKTTLFVEEEDLFQSGCMAFVKTLSKFDPSRYSNKGLGSSFAVYLRHWTRDYVQKSTCDQQPIHHPRGYGMPYVVHKSIEDFVGRYGRQPDASELGTYKGEKITDKMLDSWRAANHGVVSLDNPAGGVEFRKNTDFVEIGQDRPDFVQAPDSSKSPARLFERAEALAALEKVKEILTPLERRIIDAVQDGVKAYKGIAEEFGVTEDDCREARSEAMFKIREILGN